MSYGVVLQVGAVPPPWSLATRPQVPDARDDEFDSATLNAAWIVTGTTRDGEVDPTQNVPTALHYRSSLNTVRPGWYMVQTNTAASPSDYSGTLHKVGLTFNTNDFIWTRFSTNGNGGVNDGEVSLFIGDATNTNYVMAAINRNSAAKAIAWAKNGVADTTAAVNGLVSGGAAQLPTLVSYLGIQKLGTTWNFWLATGDGSWWKYGTVVNAFTPTRVDLAVRTNLTVPSPIMGFDFIRFRSGGGLP